MIAALKENDEVVFTEIFSEYHEKVYFYTLSKTNSPYIVEETTQLTFIKLWNYRSGLNEELSISSQIFRIARTTYIDLLRKESSRTKVESKCSDDKIIHDVHESLHTKELQTQLTALVNQMPPMRRTVFSLSRFESKSHKEIADMLL